MNFLKRLMILTAVLVFALVNTLPVEAETVKNTSKAEKLKLLGLFQGTASGFMLDKTFTRAEGAAMILRLSGLEAKALADTAQPVFTDVPKGHWAVKHINYAYKNKIVNGVSSTKFNPDSTMTGKQFIALVLRSLGYHEANPETAFALAVQSGLLSLKRAEALTEKKLFLRDDMVEVAYSALCTKGKKSPKTLLQRLVENDKAVLKETAKKSGLYKESSAMDKIEDAIKRKLSK